MRLLLTVALVAVSISTTVSPRDRAIGGVPASAPGRRASPQVLQEGAGALGHVPRARQSHRSRQRDRLRRAQPDLKSSLSGKLTWMTRPASSATCARRSAPSSTPIR